MEKRELICIGCPMGCALSVTFEAGQIAAVTGNTCKRGDDYAHKEVTHPTRIVTSTVRVSGGTVTVVSVKTQSDIPKDKIMDCIHELKDISVTAPIAIGDVILSGVAGTDVNIIATRNVLNS